MTERYVDNPRFVAARSTAGSGIELAYEADRAFDVMKALQASLEAYQAEPTVQGRLEIHDNMPIDELEWNEPYRRARDLMERSYLAQHALFHDLGKAAQGLIGVGKLGSEYLQEASRQQP